ncbi:MAG: sodium:alanine symporter family protein [Clostridia bacterium]|nr:sodium:alanine symporter family protein [Clostridia bacterium]
MSGFIFRLRELCWNPLLLAAFFGVGLYFSIRSGFLQIRRPLYIFRSTFGSIKKADAKDGISPFAALSAALAACMGTGNIIGVASALTLGGPGAVFWMVISALLGEMTSCAENILGIEYRTKNEKNEWMGGSLLYIEKAFGRKTACVFSVFCIGAALGMGNMTQANTISTAVCEQTAASPVALGVAVAAVVGMVIIGGVKRVSGVTEKIIPSLSLAVIVALIAVIIKNYSLVVPCIKQIFVSAFDSGSVASGMSSYTLSKALKEGFARGVFSNEAGLGSSPLVHASAHVKEPLTQGLWGIAEVFIDTVLMCTLTALALMTSGAYGSDNSLSPIQMSVAAFSDILGDSSSVFVCVSLCLFAFATIIGWGFYGEKAVEYAFGEKAIAPYRIVFLICTVVGSCASLDTVWALSDIFNALMAVPNLAAIIVLRKKAVYHIKKSATDNRD